MCRTFIIRIEGDSRRENSSCQVRVAMTEAQKLLMGGRTGFSGHQIHAFSSLPHRSNEEELRMKRMDDNTPAVGKQLAGGGSFSLYLPFLFSSPFPFYTN